MILDFLIPWIPQEFSCRWAGKLVRWERPKWLAAIVKHLLVKVFAIDMVEAEKNICDYANFHEVFIRKLRSQSRPISSSVLVSPCDGFLTSAVEIIQGKLIQCKGRDYPIAELFQSESLADDFEGGVALTLYLSPKDYHRVHLPFQAKLLSSQKISGKKWPVNPWAVANVEKLFCMNERIRAEFELMDGKKAVMLLVGALNVSRMPFSIEIEASIESGEVLEKGCQFARFELGSTVILILPPPWRNQLSHVELGTVLMGQSLLKRGTGRS